MRPRIWGPDRLIFVILEVMEGRVLKGGRDDRSSLLGTDHFLGKARQLFSGGGSAELR